MTPAFLRISIRREGQSGVTSETRMIGVSGGVVGGWVGSNGAGRTSTSSHDETRWDTDALVFTDGTYTRDTSQRTVGWSEHSERWSLDSDGRLHVEMTSEAAGVPRRTETLLYRRQ